MNIAKQAIQFIWTIFIQGLLALLPITLTIALFNFSFKILQGWLKPIQAIEPYYLKDIPFSEFLLTITAILCFGLILHFFFLQALINVLEYILSKIPLVGATYSGIKQLIHAFNPHDTVNFKQVVFVEFPRPGIYSVGFLTSEINPEIAPENNQKYFSVFVPTTPNPTTGFFFMIAQEHVRPTTLTRQEAMALIMSGGIIVPERFNKNNQA